METLNKSELLRYLNDLKSLKGVSSFQRFMNGNAIGISYLNDSLASMEPTDTVGIARIQGEVLFRKKLQREYEDCEKLIFELANQNKTDIHNNNEGGIVPPHS